MNWRDAFKHTIQQNKEQLGQAAEDLWQAPQNLIGLGQGFLKTGKMPWHSMSPDGHREFRFDTPGEDPLSMGSVIMGDPENLTPARLGHERVHGAQSRETGPAYMAARMIGERMSGTGDPYFGHPYEDEAYASMPDGDPDKDYYNMMVNSLRRKQRGE